MPNDMMDDISSIVTVAAIAGANYGRQVQANNEIQEWADYSNELKSQIQKLKDKLQDAELARKLTEIKTDITTNTLKEEIRNKDVVIADITAKNEDSDYSLSQQLNYKKALIKKMEHLTRQSQVGSANAAAYEELFKLLIEEIKNAEDPTHTSFLNSEKCAAIFNARWERFMETGEVYHEPDRALSYIPRI